MKRAWIVGLWAWAAWAGPSPVASLLKDGLEGVERAQRQLRYAHAGCQSNLAVQTLQALGLIETIAQEGRPQRAAEARDTVKQLVQAAEQAQCPPPVQQELGRALASLDRALSFAGGPAGVLQVRISAPDFKHHVTHASGAPGVELRAGGVFVDGAQGRQVRVVLRWRGADPSRWSDATVSDAKLVAGPSYNTAFTTITPYDVLRGLAGPDGVVTARLSVYAEDNSELGFTEAATTLPGPAVAPPPPGAPPPVVPPPVPGAVARDCGTGVDPGCGLARGGLLPLDADAFGGLTQALKGTPSEVAKLDMCRSVLRSSALTALQLGALMDFFDSEITKLELARAAAPKLTNPKSAFGLATKFRSSPKRQSFTQLMAAQ